jgi:hypothetical protein
MHLERALSSVEEPSISASPPNPGLSEARRRELHPEVLEYIQHLEARAPAASTSKKEVGDVALCSQVALWCGAESVGP